MLVGPFPYVGPHSIFCGSVYCPFTRPEDLKRVGVFFGFDIQDSTSAPLCTLPICCNFYDAKCFFNRCSVELKYTFGTGKRPNFNDVQFQSGFKKSE